jgi:hypothetical protein
VRAVVEGGEIEPNVVSGDGGAESLVNATSAAAADNAQTTGSARLTNATVFSRTGRAPRVATDTRHPDLASRRSPYRGTASCAFRLCAWTDPAQVG